MNSINQDNIDEIMFRLLEGDIQGAERSQLLDAIAADPEYSAMWNAWQNTIICPDESLTMDKSNLLKNKVIPFYLKFSIAASIVLILGLSIFLFNAKTSPKIQTFSHDNKPVQLKKDLVEPLKPSNTLNIPNEIFKTTDSFTISKESIKTIAHKSNIIINNTPLKSNPIQDSTINSIANIEIVKPKEKLVFQDTEKQIEKSATKNEILVSITNSPSLEKSNSIKKESNFFRRLVGNVKFKIEDDSSTLTNKKIIIENKKYQIIAGY